MVTCTDFYEKFEKVGNFCQKSENTAKQIEEYIDYKKRNRLKDVEINRCALFPLIKIEDKGMLHNECLKKVKKEVKRLGAKNITRRHIIEIINEVNLKVPITERIDNIPMVRSRMDGNQHAIEGLSHETREHFDNLKNEIHLRGNDEVMNTVLDFCDSMKKEFEDFMEGHKGIEIIKEN